MRSSIVFDLDGTLITCENKQKYVLQSILNSNAVGVQVELDKWWNLKRNGYNTKDALFELGVPNAVLLADRWVAMIENFAWSNLDKPFEDSLPILKTLKDNYNISIKILTARSFAFKVNQAICIYGFDSYIDDVIVVNPREAVQSKAVYLNRIKPLIFIGDTELDYMAALQSHTKFVAISRGQRCYEYLSKLGEIKIESDLKFLEDPGLIKELLADRNNYDAKN